MRRAASAPVVVAAVLLALWGGLAPLIEQRLNSDEALVGLMAKHLAEGRAFPLFLYSLPHILGITSWIAAPFLAIGGPTVVMLRTPILLMYLALVGLLVYQLQKDARLRPGPALIAALPVAVAPPLLAHNYFMDAAGGSIEPCLVVLLLWALRHRPLAFGIVLGIGILNRPFAAYSTIALLALQLWDRSIFQARVWKGWLVSAVAVAAVLTFVYSVRVWSSPAGPGTTFDPRAPDTIAVTMGFVCVDPFAVVKGTWLFVSDVLPYMFGAEAPAPQLPYLLGLALVVLTLRLWSVSRARRAVAHQPGLAFALYLTMLGLLGALVYVAARCGAAGFETMRYALLTPFASVGLLAILFTLEPSRIVRVGVAILVSVWSSIQFAEHSRLLAFALTHESANPRRDLARYLDDHGVRFAVADFWDAEVLTFLTEERVIVASSGVVRITPYQAIVTAHQAEAVEISQKPCAAGGVEAVPRVYWLCPM